MIEHVIPGQVVEHIETRKHYVVLGICLAKADNAMTWEKSVAYCKAVKCSETAGGWAADINSELFVRGKNMFKQNFKVIYVGNTEEG